MTEETVHEEEAPRKRRGIASFFRRIADRLRRGEKVPVDEEQSVTAEVPADTGGCTDVKTRIENPGGKSLYPQIAETGK